ncbi:MAG TPA: hypothetical protein VMF69_16935 [Gemmataceae bacterium]|nr:hypothetical protein [Gemmataceae bacterium]
MGANIEEQVVRTLNLIRSTWDADGRYALYSFVRRPQTFPDVRLRKASGDETLMGVELKGWYLLAKEGEPSLRFQATAAACAKQDFPSGPRSAAAESSASHEFAFTQRADCVFDYHGT